MSRQSPPQARLTIAASFPAHFFLENLAVRQDDSILITAVTWKELYYLPPPRPMRRSNPYCCIHSTNSPRGLPN